MKKNLFFLILILQVSTLFGQDNLLVFSEDRQTDNHKININFNDLSFIKDNEYFNLIADGYTLFGNQLDLNLSLNVDDNYKISIGAIATKYYGLHTISSIVPTISLKIYQGKNTYFFGKLKTDDNHHLPEQLYSFERHLDTRSIENGVEHRYKNKHWQTDTWLEWEHFIYKNDSNRERLNFGQTTTFTTVIAKNFQLQIPVNILLHHRGGQINNRNSATAHLNNAMVISNFSGGLLLAKKISKNKQFGIEFQYFIHSINSDNVEEFQFKNGKATLFNAFYKTKKWQYQLGYWKSAKFLAPKGNDMFQSISKRTEIYTDTQGNPEAIFANYSEPDRTLLYGNISYKSKMYKSLYIGAKVDAYLQLNKGQISTNRYSGTTENQFDYAIGLYLLYKFKGQLWSVR